jgi:hypothetical protein
MLTTPADSLERQIYSIANTTTSIHHLLNRIDNRLLHIEALLEALGPQIEPPKAA